MGKLRGVWQFILTSVVISGCTWFDPYELPQADISLHMPLEAVRVGSEYQISSGLPDTRWSIFKEQNGQIVWHESLGEVNGDTLRIVAGTNEREFFVGINESGDTLRFTNKHITFEGPVNFRDLGGMMTRAGETVTWGRLYRSGKLTDVSEEDGTRLTLLDINTIIDFRTDPEVRDEPDEVPNGTNYLRLPIGDTTFTNRDFIGKLREIESTVAMDSVIMTVYTQLPLFTEEYQDFFRYISDTTNLPLVFHCTAGKDRTGIATALFYHVLGVDWELIRLDYEMSNYYRYEENLDYVDQFKLYGLDPRLVEVLMTNRAEQLDGIVQAIEGNYGSLDSYLTEKLGVDDSVRQRLRQIYLD